MLTLSLEEVKNINGCKQEIATEIATEIVLLSNLELLDTSPQKKSRMPL